MSASNFEKELREIDPKGRRLINEVVDSLSDLEESKDAWDANAVRSAVETVTDHLWDTGNQLRAARLHIAELQRSLDEARSQLEENQRLSAQRIHELELAAVKVVENGPYRRHKPDPYNPSDWPRPRRL